MASEPNTSPLQRSVAFTGRLASMKREEAFALVRKMGGTPRRGLSKTTAVLVVGELGWPLLPDGKPSKSLSLAKSYGGSSSNGPKRPSRASRPDPIPRARSRH
jgi:hypothetical protein